MSIPTSDSPAFIPDPLHVKILKEVSDKPGCTISHVVVRLIADHGESTIRSRVHQLIAKRYLFEGRSMSQIQLTITSKGRLTLLQATV